MGIFDTIGSWFAPDISGPMNRGLQTGYNLAAPQLQSWQQYINQLYPQAQQAITGYGGQAVDTLRNLYNMYAPTAQTYASATSGATGPGSAWDAFTKSPFYSGGQQNVSDVLARQAAASGRTGSGGEAVDLGKALTNYSSGQYGNWINSLLPGVQAANTAGTNIATTLGNIGSGLAGSLQDQAKAIGGPLSSLANLGWGLGTGQGATATQQGMLNAITGGNVLGGLLNFAGSSGGSGMLSGLGSGLMAALPIFSDERLKENLDQVGELYDGLGIFRYNYVDDPTPRIGLVAQDVERRYPDAVTEIGGYKAVDYAKATDRAASIFDAFLKAA